MRVLCRAYADDCQAQCKPRLAKRNRGRLGSVDRRCQCCLVGKLGCVICPLAHGDGVDLFGAHAALAEEDLSGLGALEGRVTVLLGEGEVVVLGLDAGLEAGLDLVLVLVSEVELVHTVDSINTSLETKNAWSLEHELRSEVNNPQCTVVLGH